ncbi:SAVED domain-containing protein [Burkholderia orbicola]|uniref:SAVED domain-containing protein n=1 Tax=Burkholderia orbicola TaxID=2978683 RepID=UPI0039A419A8
MSTFSDYQVPAPLDWQRFERLCRDLFSAHWGDPSAQQNGRGGQQQNGVDCYGTNARSGNLEGIQCKGKDGRYDKALTVDELENEVAKALTFTPPLSRFIVATSGQTDAKVQQTAREISDRHRASGLFEVEVKSWDQVVLLFEQHADVFRTHYSDLVRKMIEAGAHESPLIAIRHQSQEAISEPFAAVRPDAFQRAIVPIDCNATMAYENGVLDPIVALRQQFLLVQQLEHHLTLHPRADVAYFGIAHIPLVFHAGAAVSTKRPVALYELERSSGTWTPVSGDAGPDLGISLVEKGGDANSAVGALSVEISYPVPLSDVRAVVGDDIRHWVLGIEKPRIDAVRYESQVEGLASLFRDVLDIVCPRRRNFEPPRRLNSEPGWRPV